MLVDSHCHLYFNCFKKINNVLRSAESLGVKHFVVPGINLKTNKQTLNLAKNFKNIYPALGIYPFEISKTNLSLEKQINKLENLVKNNLKKIIAAGECGLDFSPPPPEEKKRSRKDQIKLFNSHIKLALKYNLPLIVHKRKADKEVFSSLKPFKRKVRGVFHCFTEDEAFFKKASDYGFYLGLAGNLTYNKKLQKVVKNIPLNNLLLETDSPFLTPYPINKKQKWPNQPKNVKIIALKLAELKNTSFAKVASITSQNARKLFKFN